MSGNYKVQGIVSGRQGPATVWTALFCALMAASDALAESMKCPDPPSQIARDVSVETRGKIAGLSKLAVGEVQNQTRVIAKPLLETAPNADRVIVAQMLASIFCQTLVQSKLSDDTKFDRFSAFNSQITSLILNNPAPDMQSRSSQPKPPASKQQSLSRPPAQKSIDITGTWRDVGVPTNVSKVEQTGNQFRLERTGNLTDGTRFITSGRGSIAGESLTVQYAAQFSTGRSSNGTCTGLVTASGDLMSMKCQGSVLGAFEGASERARD